MHVLILSVCCSPIKSNYGDFSFSFRSGVMGDIHVLTSMSDYGYIRQFTPETKSGNNFSA